MTFIKSSHDSEYSVQYRYPKAPARPALPLLASRPQMQILTRALHPSQELQELPANLLSFSFWNSQRGSKLGQCGGTLGPKEETRTKPGASPQGFGSQGCSCPIRDAATEDKP